MSILDRDALAASPLADLHALASELSIDGYRRLRKDDLIDAILARQGGEPSSEEPRDEDAQEEDARKEGAREDLAREEEAREDEEGAGSGPTDDGAAAVSEDEAGESPGPESIEELGEEGEGAVRRERRGGGREEEIVEGEVELLPNGSGFLRVNPPEPSEDDVYVSAAQFKRCELVPGDRIAGPRRGPRRSERFASLVRIDSI